MNKLNWVKVRVQSRIIDLIEKETDSRVDKFFLWGLLWLSFVFKLLISLRRRLYSRRKVNKRYPRMISVCVGNIVAGGSGKTPMVMSLADQLSRFYKVAVISKGYWGDKVNKKEVIDLSITDNPKMFGDEPVMIKKKCPDCHVLVSKSRDKSLQAAYKLGCDVALMDDGFQDLKLRPDFNIIMIKSPESIKKGYFLPRGYLRDDPCTLSQADYIGLSESLTQQKFEEERLYIQKYTRAKIFGLYPQDLKILGTRQLELSELKNKKIGVFSAIAQPKSFETYLKNLGALVMDRYFLIDHSFFDRKILQDFVQSCQTKGVSYIFCTLKDYVKLPQNLKTSLPILYLDYTLGIKYQKQEYEDLLTAINERIRDNKIKREASL